MQNNLKIITNWLKDSVSKVNEEKTKLCLFYRRDSHPIEIILNNITVKSLPFIYVLGVCFHSKLTWSMHVANTINKANKALHAIRLIKKYFNQQEILQLLTANFYSILFYNSEIWHLPTLRTDLKKHLLSASAIALKLSKTNPDPLESYVNIHKSSKRALPNQLLVYKHAILFHKIYNKKSLPWTG